MRSALVLLGVGAAIALGVYVYKRNAPKSIGRPSNRFDLVRR